MNEKTLIAQELAKMGRGGDTMLAHINPQEATVLKMMGGSGSINPYTGLPEFGFFKSLKNAFKKIIKVVAAVAVVAIAIYAPQLIPAIGETVLGTVGVTGVSSTAAYAAGSATIAAVNTAIQGGDLGDVVKNAAMAAVGATVATEVASAVNNSLVNSGVNPSVAKIAASTAGAGSSAIATGGDPSKAITTSLITSTANVTYDNLTSTPRELTAAPDRGVEPAPGVDSAPTDYSPAAGMTFPGQGLKTPDLAPLPAAESIGVTPIDYGNIFAPTAPSTGYKAPNLQKLPPAEQIGTKPVDYESLMTPETRNLPEMGGGTGLTGRDAAGSTIGLAPSERSPIKDVGKAATSLLAGDFARSLYDSPSSTSTSALISTGLFTPQSIIPTAISGIAPSAVATGRSITEGSEDEATGAWGAKTLRG